MWIAAPTASGKRWRSSAHRDRARARPSQSRLPDLAGRYSQYTGYALSCWPPHRDPAVLSARELEAAPARVSPTAPSSRAWATRRTSAITADALPELPGGAHLAASTASHRNGATCLGAHGAGFPVDPSSLEARHDSGRPSTSRLGGSDRPAGRVSDGLRISPRLGRWWACRRRSGRPIGDGGALRGPPGAACAGPAEGAGIVPGRRRLSGRPVAARAGGSSVPPCAPPNSSGSGRGRRGRTDADRSLKLSMMQFAAGLPYIDRGDISCLSIPLFARKSHSGRGHRFANCPSLRLSRLLAGHSARHRQRDHPATPGSARIHHVYGCAADCGTNLLGGGSAANVR